jgi:hypothetical protein
MKATEQQWLEWFYQEADFGPADSDVRYYMKKDFMKATGLDMPEGYEEEE